MKYKTNERSDRAILELSKKFILRENLLLDIFICRKKEWWKKVYRRMWQIFEFDYWSIKGLNIRIIFWNVCF